VKIEKDLANENSFFVEDGSDSYSISFLSKGVAIYGTVGHQVFLCPGVDTVEKAKKVFSNESTLLQTALFHKNNVVSKERFIASLDDLQRRRIITDKDKIKLKNFISNTDFVPEAVRRRLPLLGYPHLVEIIRFEEPNPIFEKTFNAVKTFLKSV
jgi:hypothetical protein